MKLFVLLFLLTVVYSEELQVTPEFDAVYEECAKSENLDIEMAAKAYEAMHYPNEKNFKCFLKCTMVKTNLMTETGELLIDNIKKDKNVVSTMSEEKRWAAIEACKGVKAEDACEIAYTFCKCTDQQYGLLLEESST